MDSSSLQPAGNSLVGDQHTSTALPPVNHSIPTDGSLLDKLNTHQFDNVIQPDINLNRPSSQFAPQQPKIATDQTANAPFQTPSSNAPASSTQPIQPPIPSVTTLEPIAATPQTAQQPAPPANIAPNLSPTPNKPATVSQTMSPPSVQIEYPNPIVQQQTIAPQPTPTPTAPADISFPSPSEIPPNLRSTYTPPSTSLPQFGSPYASITQSVIPPLQPVINQPLPDTNPPPIPPTPTIPQPPITAAAPQVATSQIAPDTINPANLPQPKLNVNPQRFEQKKTLSLVMRIIQSLTTATLTFQGLRGLYSSLHFIIIEFPIFEQALNEHQLGEETVNTFAIKAGLMILSTAVSLFFAVQLAIFRSKTVKILNIIVGIIITVLSILVMHYAQNIHILDSLPSLLPTP